MTRKRARIGDVIRLTGLSRATIDRVLNARPGVKSSTKSKVEAALKELGYAPDVLTSRVAAQPAGVEVFVPVGPNPFFKVLRDGLEAAIDLFKYTNLTIRFREFDPYDSDTLSGQLRRVKSDIAAVIAVGVEAPEVEAALEALQRRGIKVLTFVSDTPRAKRTAYIGQDNLAAGRTAGRLMLGALGDRTGTLAVMLSNFQFRHFLDRQAGFGQICAALRPGQAVTTTPPFGQDPTRSATIMKDLAQAHPDLAGIYIAGGSQPGGLATFAQSFDPAPVIIGHEVTPFSREALHSGLFRFVISHDTVDMGRKAIRAVLADELPAFIPSPINIHVAENLP
ncbi:LacI family DNA-binding transcriptional regulator [Sulfitobacter sp. M368]|uniref:LacI family DNA-binding transcriptional regulator n=1 Tax=Sulfitobacter sp. M368 TaxID=2867021 RepID=UPI0021A948AD|nr:LacI family DNA-binding transcriptional regulator [Sulfitobacter sp. M368]UWR14434.1 LacI family DNA-binding transcriptional regulator [Sulfitobacter sp. M368]